MQLQTALGSCCEKIGDPDGLAKALEESARAQQGGGTKRNPEEALMRCIQKVYTRRANGIFCD